MPINSSFCALRVSGDEMEDEGINDGDFILVKQRKNREIVQHNVVLINNYEKLLIKFIKKEKQLRAKILTRKRCPACKKKEDLDGRCGCTNQDAW